MMQLKAVLTIAGSDSSGGAGIQADLKTMLAHGVYGMSAITALTAQNTQGVSAIWEAPPEFLTAQLDAIYSDIRPDAVKIGMMASPPLMTAVAASLRRFRAVNVVVDPVMVATSGARLMAAAAEEVLARELFPLAALLTPNLPELEILAGAPVASREARIEAARRIAATWGCAVLTKGGHAVDSATDILVTEREVTVFPGKRLKNPNTHGTGCTLSSAIAANLAKGFSLAEAVGRAKEYVTGALAADLDLGQGKGPLHHGFDIKSRFAVADAAASQRQRQEYLTAARQESLPDFAAERIAPFLWLERGEASSVCLNTDSSDYLHDIFASRSEEGAEGSAADWERLAKSFIAAACPELSPKLHFTSREALFQVEASGDRQDLWRFITRFKDACDDHSRILELFKRSDMADG